MSDVEGPAIDDTQPTIQVELTMSQAEVRSGEVLGTTGAVSHAVWVQGRGRRMHASNEPAEVNLFMDPDDALQLAIEIIVAQAVVRGT